MTDAITMQRPRARALVQLTTDQSSVEALAFCERIGFRATHEGMKLALDVPAHRLDGPA